MSLSLPRPDRFLLAIITAAVLASIFPATGAAVPVLSWASKIMMRGALLPLRSPALAAGVAGGTAQLAPARGSLSLSKGPRQTRDPERLREGRK